LNEQLKALANTLDVEIATDPGLIDQGKQWILERRDGESFDAAYLNSQITEHQQSIELFKDAQQSRDQELSALAGKTVSTLESHLETAKKLSRDRANAEE
jgi:putative membrane protein